MKPIIWSTFAVLFLSLEGLAVIKIEIDEQKKEEEKKEEEKPEEGKKEEEEEEAPPPDSILMIKAQNKTKYNYVLTVYAAVKGEDNESIWLQGTLPKQTLLKNFGTLIAPPGKVFELDPSKTYVHAQDEEISIACNIVVKEKKEGNGEEEKKPGGDEEKGDKPKGDDDKEKSESDKGKDAVSAKEEGEEKDKEEKGEEKGKEEKGKEEKGEEKNSDEPEYIAKKSIHFDFYDTESGPKCSVKFDVD